MNTEEIKNPLQAWERGEKLQTKIYGGEWVDCGDRTELIERLSAGAVWRSAPKIGIIPLDETNFFGMCVWVRNGHRDSAGELVVKADESGVYVRSGFIAYADLMENYLRFDGRHWYRCEKYGWV